MNAAISMTTVDFGISEGHRTLEKQQEYYNAIPQLSKCDGIVKKSKHQSLPSLACDIYAYVDGKASYDKETLSYLAGMIEFIGKQLYMSKKITHLIQWGGSWTTFVDMPHYQIYKPKYQ